MRATGRLLRAAVAGSALVCACAWNPVAPGERPCITRITPDRASPGDVVVITGSGFLAAGNAVKIGSGYLLDLSSPDGATLRFTLPSYLGVCPPRAGVCVQLAIQLSPGHYQVSVVNDRGTSNQVSFEVVERTD